MLAASGSLLYVRSMPTATVTSKGQVTLPAKMRDALGLVPGSKVEFEEQPNGDYLGAPSDDRHP